AIAWVASLPAFGYGLLESTLSGVFPVYGLRLGHDVEMLSLIIPCFAIGSIVLQFPLGAWSDVLGRRKVLLISIALGIISFICASIYEDSDRKSTRLNSSHVSISYAVFCLKKKKAKNTVI